MWSEFLFHLVSLPVCVDLYVVRLSMSLGLTSVLYVSLYGVLVSMSLGLTSVLYGFLCCPSFYVTWFLLSFCRGLYVVRLSMLLGLTSVLYVYLWCTSFYVT